MSNRILISLATVAATGALGVAGCGGDDETTSSTTAGASGATGVSGAALSEDEFVKQANAICAAGDKEVDQAANELFGSGQPTDEQVEGFAADTLVPSIQGQIDAIGALTPPDELSDQVSTFLDDAESALDEVENDPSVLQAADGEGPFAEVNQQADELGLTNCAG